MNLIQSLGSRYCADMIVGALILYNNRPAIISSMGDTRSAINYLDGREESAHIPSDYFTGWKVLAYPPLGYRRVGNNVYHVHRNQTAYRGIRNGVLTFRNSPMTQMLIHHAERRGVEYESPTQSEKLACVMVPNYDNEASLDLLVEGRIAACVPNEDFCIEPSITENNYNILYREKQVGTMDSSKNFSVSNPAVLAFLRAAFTE